MFVSRTVRRLIGLELHFQTKTHCVNADHHTWTLFMPAGGTTWDKMAAVAYRRVS